MMLWINLQCQLSIPVFLCYDDISLTTVPTYFLVNFCLFFFRQGLSILQCVLVLTNIFCDWVFRTTAQEKINDVSLLQIQDSEIHIQGYSEIRALEQKEKIGQELTNGLLENYLAYINVNVLYMWWGPESWLSLSSSSRAPTTLATAQDAISVLWEHQSLSQQGQSPASHSPVLLGHGPHQAKPVCGLTSQHSLSLALSSGWCLMSGAVPVPPDSPAAGWDDGMGPGWQVLPRLFHWIPCCSLPPPSPCPQPEHPNSQFLPCSSLNIEHHGAWLTAV